MAVWCYRLLLVVFNGVGSGLLFWQRLACEHEFHKFRDVRDVSQFVFRYWQMASGNFVPEKLENLGAHYTIKSDRENVKQLCKYVTTSKYGLLCLNDADLIDTYEDFVWAKKQLIKAFDELLPDKSVFEK